MCFYYTPSLNEVEVGILVLPSPSVRLSICPSVDRMVSTLYLPQYLLDPFHFYTSYIDQLKKMCCM